MSISHSLRTLPLARALARRLRGFGERGDGVSIDSAASRAEIIYPAQAHFGGGPLHRAVAHERIDLEQLCSEHRRALVRSNSRHLHEQGQGWEWASLLFRFGEVFMLVKFSSNPDSRDYVPGGGVLLAAYASTPEKARQHLVWVQERYRVAEEPEQGPCYYLMRVKFGSLSEVEPVPLSKDAGKQDLELHYGEDFATWSRDFFNMMLFNENGLSILRGPPGTGKTSFIRFLIRNLHGSHRFHFLPLTEFHWLASAEFVDHWKKEMARHPTEQQVVVLEDAETLLMPRDADNRTGVSTLLNIADGLLADFLRIHVICTINSELEAIDPAILRPGRLMALRNFTPLAYKDARRLAETLKITLPEEREYTLAEIYNQTTRHLTAQRDTEGHPIGFSA